MGLLCLSLQGKSDERTRGRHCMVSFSVVLVYSLYTLIFTKVFFFRHAVPLPTPSMVKTTSETSTLLPSQVLVKIVLFLK